MSGPSILGNIHICAANKLDVVPGGLVLTNGMTNATLYSMVEITFIFSMGFILSDESQIWLQRDAVPFRAGKYYILTAGSIAANQEIWQVFPSVLSVLRSALSSARDARPSPTGISLTLFIFEYESFLE
ncbi:hypothetical protein HOY82DRAFT_595285 [Tuber indicum]|nr:hypothetical protein HOY82DRAFT_595285 [Tuber indicum]